MKALTFLFTLFIMCFVQAKSQAQLEIKKNVLLFIEGHMFETYFNVDNFKKGFRLKLSDPTYKIKKFNFNWSTNNGTINEVVFQDSIINSKEKDYSFEDANGDFFIDNIMVEKEGRLFLIPAQLFHLVESGEYNSIYDTLARNKAYLMGRFEGDFFISSGLFKDKFKLGLRDTSYNITSFDMLFISLKDGKELRFHFIGDSGDPSSDSFKLAVSRLSDNDMVIFSNIKALKNGKTYTIPELTVVKRGD